MEAMITSVIMRQKKLSGEATIEDAGFYPSEVLVLHLANHTVGCASASEELALGLTEEKHTAKISMTERGYYLSARWIYIPL